MDSASCPVVGKHKIKKRDQVRLVFNSYVHSECFLKGINIAIEENYKRKKKTQTAL